MMRKSAASGGSGGMRLSKIMLMIGAAAVSSFLLLLYLLSIRQQCEEGTCCMQPFPTPPLFDLIVACEADKLRLSTEQMQLRSNINTLE